MADRKNRVPKRTRPKPLPEIPVVPTPSVKREPWYHAWYDAPSAIAAFVFACLVGIMWGAHNPHAGLPFETAFPYVSETSTALRGFFSDDWMRVHTNTFYQLGYLLGEGLGIRGSYVPYQVVYALLWWARGFLVFAILRRLLPASPALCYSAGALAVVHSSDSAMMWLGQMNQFGFMFWMLLAMYCFVRAWDARRWPAAVPLAAAAVAFEYMSLWSYESQILLILLFPVVLMLTRREWRKPARLITWYSVPAVYFYCTYLRYTRSGGQTYQESVLRKSWSLASIASDWAFNIGSSLEFWTWQRLDWRSPRGEAYLLSALAALVFAAGWVAIIRRGSDRDRPNPFAASIQECWGLLAGGFAALALSFPVYLLLDTSRGLWRTQMLSGIGCGIFMAAVLGLISWLPLRRIGRMAVVIPAGAVVVYYGSVAAIEKGGIHRWSWDQHRAAMLEILKIAPDIQPNSVVVLTNVPKAEDPFSHNLWFDMALRLAYPGIPVAGVYFFTDGTPGPGNNLTLEGSSWHWDGKGFGRIVSDTSLEKTVAVEYQRTGGGRLLDALPSFVCDGNCAAKLYRPSAAIITGPVSHITAWRYSVPNH